MLPYLVKFLNFGKIYGSNKEIFEPLGKLPLGNLGMGNEWLKKLNKNLQMQF
jgi:hypothetical protein